MNNTLEFDGQSTYVEVGELQAPTNNGGAITVEFWNKIDSASNSYAFWFKTDDESKRVSCHAPWGDNKLYWDCGSPADKDTGGRLVVDYTDYLGKWSHIALVSTGGVTPEQGNPAMAIYINGELKASSTVAKGPGVSLKGLVIGARIKPSSNPSTYERYHKGMIDDFRLWSYARTAEEIKRDMHVELVGDESNLVTYFSFNWGVPGSPDKSLDWVKQHPNEVHKNLPNMVPDAPDGVLTNFDKAKWVATGVDFRGAPIGPVYKLTTTTSGSDTFYTTKPKEKDKKIADKWESQNSLFYAHRGPTPGTTPLYRLSQKTATEERYILTISTAERDKLDPRTEVNQPVALGNWVDEGEIAYVSASQNGDGIPLYRGYNAKTQRYLYTTNSADITGDYTTSGIVCYVLPGVNSRYAPKSVSFRDNQLSEQVWYVLLCRSYKEGWGVKLDEGNNVVLAEIPKTGDYTRFQWRLEDNVLVNRASSDKVLAISNNQPTVQDKAKVQAWTLTSIAGKGNDSFALVQGNRALQCDVNGTLSTADATSTSNQTPWTFLAMELLDDYTLPDPPIEHSGLPYSKYLAALPAPKTGNRPTIHILGTGAVSDWAMLRVKLIVENMVGALKQEVNTTGVNEMEVLVINKEDSNDEVTKYPCIGFLMRGDAELVGGIRGGYFWAGGGSLCYVTEEMMWKTGVFNRPGDKTLRYFDQVVHEFGHMMDGNLGFNGGACPVASEVPTLSPAESYAISVQSWFSSIAMTNTTYSPATRKELQEKYAARYTYIARHFDANNTWLPPIEPRNQPGLM